MSVPGPAPDPAIVGWAARAGAWIAIGASPGGIMVGAALSSRHGLLVGLAASAASALLLGGFCFLQARTAQRLGANLGVLIRRLMISPVARTTTELVLAASMVGWLAFYVSIQAQALGGRPWIVVVTIALALIALGGLRRWNVLVWVASTGTLALAVALLITLGDDATGPAEDWSALPGAAASALGFGAVFVIRCADFSHDLRARSDVLSAATMFIGSLMVFQGLGALLGARQGEWDLVALSQAGPTSGLARAILLVSSAGAALTSIHSGGLALQHATGASRRVGIACMAVAASILATTRFDLALRGWLGWLGLVALPLAIVLLGAERRVQPLATTDAAVLAASIIAALLVRALGIDWYVFVAIAVAAGGSLARRPYRATVRRTG